MSSTSSRGWAWIRAWGQSVGRDVDILKVSYAGLYFMMLGAGERKWSRPFFCERMSESPVTEQRARSYIMHQDERCETQNPTVLHRILRVTDPTE